MLSRLSPQKNCLDQNSFYANSKIYIYVLQTDNVSMSQSLSLSEIPFEKISSRSSTPSSMSGESKKDVVQSNVWHGLVQKTVEYIFSELYFTKVFLKDFRHWWLAALLFLFAMHMQSLKLHPTLSESNSALRTSRQALCSWRQVLCHCRQALCPASHKFLLPCLSDICAVKRVKTEAEYGVHWIGNVLPCSEMACWNMK